MYSLRKLFFHQLFGCPKTNIEPPAELQPPLPSVYHTCWSFSPPGLVRTS